MCETIAQQPHLFSNMFFLFCLSQYSGSWDSLWWAEFWIAPMERVLQRL